MRSLWEGEFLETIGADQAIGLEQGGPLTSRNCNNCVPKLFIVCSKEFTPTLGIFSLGTISLQWPL